MSKGGYELSVSRWPSIATNLTHHDEYADVRLRLMNVIVFTNFFSLQNGESVFSCICMMSTETLVLRSRNGVTPRMVVARRYMLSATQRICFRHLFGRRLTVQLLAATDILLTTGGAFLYWLIWGARVTCVGLK